MTKLRLPRRCFHAGTSAAAWYTLDVAIASATRSAGGFSPSGRTLAVRREHEGCKRPSHTRPVTPRVSRASNQSIERCFPIGYPSLLLANMLGTRASLYTLYVFLPWPASPDWFGLTEPPTRGLFFASLPGSAPGLRSAHKAQDTEANAPRAAIFNSSPPLIGAAHPPCRSRSRDLANGSRVVAYPTGSPRQTPAAVPLHDAGRPATAAPSRPPRSPGSIDRSWRSR
jgi:hypothetical protein